MDDYNRVPEEYRPISMWGYFGYSILFSIPFVGIILICIFSFGGSRNINLRNYARSYFCWLLIAAIIFVLMLMLGGTAALQEYVRSLTASV
ncbi:MAG: hypothetical protein J6E44_00685 [Lachnospiraceae bacterium]|nr:hypothetical protein [Lachnospiraceae bacterium]